MVVATTLCQNNENMERDNNRHQSVCFVSFLLNVPVNNFSAMSMQSHRFLGITSTFRK